MKVKVGDHIAHHPTGDYLGVVTEVRKATVSFVGPRMRDGLPVTFACYDEIRRCKPPATQGGIRTHYPTTTTKETQPCTDS